jgi:hypothetical protein
MGVGEGGVGVGGGVGGVGRDESEAFALFMAGMTLPKGPHRYAHTFSILLLYYYLYYCLLCYLLAQVGYTLFFS